MPITVAEQAARLRAVAASGELAVLAAAHGIEIVALFGSCANPDPGIEPRDVDVAIGFVHGGRPDLLAAIGALGDLVPGDHLDVMDLNRAGPVAAKAAMFGSQILFEARPGIAAERQVQAFMAYEDTRWLRDLQLETLRS